MHPERVRIPYFTVRPYVTAAFRLSKINRGVIERDLPRGYSKSHETGAERLECISTAVYTLPCLFYNGKGDFLRILLSNVCLIRGLG